MKRDKLVSILFTNDELKLIHKKMNEVFNKTGKIVSKSTFIRTILITCLKNVSPPDNETISEDDIQDDIQDDSQNHSQDELHDKQLLTKDDKHSTLTDSMWHTYSI